MGFHVRWRAGTAGWRQPEIVVEPDGGTRIEMPLGSEIAGKDLMIECKGEFPDAMKVRGLVLHNGFYTTSAATFSYVTDTLKFMISVPTATVSDPAFAIAMQSADEVQRTLESCTVERL